MNFWATGWYILAAIAVALVAFAWSTRFLEAPTGPLPGAAFRYGERLDRAPNWSRMGDVRSVELQLLEPPRSRNTTLFVHGGQGYIPCRMPQFIQWKRWPFDAEADGRALLRHAGRIYPVMLEKVEDRKVFAEVAGELARRNDREPSGPEALWLFRLTPRLDDGAS